MKLIQSAELVGKRDGNRADKVIACLESRYVDAVGGYNALRPVERNFVDNKIDRYGLHPLSAKEGNEPHRHPAALLIVGLYGPAPRIFESDEIT